MISEESHSSAKRLFPVPDDCIMGIIRDISSFEIPVLDGLFARCKASTLSASFCLRSINDFPRNGCFHAYCQSSGKSLVAHPSWVFMPTNPEIPADNPLPSRPCSIQDETNNLPYNERDHRRCGWYETSTQFDQEFHGSSLQGTFQYCRKSLEACSLTYSFQNQNYSSWKRDRQWNM